MQIFKRPFQLLIVGVTALSTSGMALAQEGQTDTVRRVVTGLDASDKAVVLFDTEYTSPIATQQPVARDYWTLDSLPANASAVDNGLAQITAAFGPAPQKVVFRTVDFPPAPPKEIIDTTDVEMFMKIAGDESPRRGNPPVHPFTHRTKTIDFAIVLNGEIDMVLDDTTVHLKAGDMIVQQETNHAWVNNSSEVVRMAFVQLESTAE